MHKIHLIGFVFHGVVVGKICTAITISNSFIDIYKKRQK